jgi:hypothetical protein
VARARVAVAAAVLGTAVLAGCAAPDYRYASDAPGSAPGGSVYFKVPESWSGFTAAQITAAQKGWGDDPTAKPLLDVTAWQEAYDASKTPSLTHVLGSAAPDSPVVYASLRSLYQAETDSVTVSSLTDLLLPVSSLGDQVNVRSSEPVVQGKAKGLHLVLSYKASDNAPEETLDETAYLSEGNDALYLLVVRCTSTCYDRNRTDIDTVTSSYTIKEGSRG